MSNLDATIVIPTYNGDTYIEAILDALRGQEFDGDFEVLVIDSGSTDRTLEIVRARSDVRLHAIPNAEFGHGKTRNLAAQLARGTYVAYLTHDAIPADSYWLSELLAPLRDDKSGVVAVMGKQIPRPGCFPLLKYEIQGVFAGFGPDFGTTIFYDTGAEKSQGLLDALSFYSDVNSATKRDFLLEVIPYRDVPYSEDMMFGEDIIKAGYRKAYAPRAAVIHSNDLTLREYRKRMFDETVGLRRIGKLITPISRLGGMGLAARGTIRDSLRIARDPDFGRVRKLYWLTNNPRYQLAKWESYRRAAAIDLADADAIRASSLEHSRKR